MAEFTWAWVIAVIYGILIFATAWHLAKNDYDSHLFSDIGFRLHLLTYLVCNIIAETWFLLDLQSSHESIWTVHLTAIFWGIGLMIHFVLFLIARKNTIRGIDKSEIFE
jgi:hypothetical protein